MTKIGDIIDKGQPMPADVLSLLDRTGDALILNTRGHWHTPGCSDPATCDAEPASECGLNPDDYAPLTVTAVREPDRKVERAGWPEESDYWTDDADGDPAIAVREPEPAIEVIATTTVGGAKVPIYAEVREAEPDVVVHYRIPGDASPLTLCGLDVWEDSTSVTERAGSSNCATCRAAADEDKACPAHGVHPHPNGVEPANLCLDCPQCRPIASYLRAAGGDKPAEQPVLLDLVRQYGDERARDHEFALSGRDGARTSSAQALFERIAALVPQQQPSAPDFLVAVNKLTIERDEARAEVVRLTSSIESQIAAKESWIAATESIKDVVTRPLCLLLNVHHNEDIVPAVEGIKAAQPDPLVLSLPQVPPGTVALIVLSDEGDEVRFVPEAHGWVRGPNDVRGIWRLGTILSEWGDARVVMREPRTWPKLADEPNAPDVVEVEGQGRFIVAVRRTGEGSNQTTYIHEDDEDGGGLTWTLGRLRELGDVTEVFDDEPGGQR